MATERRPQSLLAVLLVVLVTVVYRVWWSSSAVPSPASNLQGTAPPASGRPATGQPAMTAPDVHLQALSDERPQVGKSDRNLFRFKPKAPPAPVVSQRPPQAPVNPEPTGPPPPPAVPPIPLKCIGTVERGGQKMAIFSDATGHVSFGPEGATIEGRYRIIRIGAESVEMAYVDGRGRQVIRITGG